MNTQSGNTEDIQATKVYDLSRIRINKADKEELKRIALDCNSIDNKGHGSLKHFFEDIASGNLIVIPKPQKPKPEDFFYDIPQHRTGQRLGRESDKLFELTITAICDLNGTIREITRIIKNENGGVHQAIAEEHSDQITIIFDCPNGETDIINKINDITLNDVMDCNGRDKQKGFLKSIGNKAIEAYSIMEDEKSRNNLIDKTIKKYKDTKIIIGIKQSFYLQIEIECETGTLHSVISTISDKGITIISLNQIVNYDERIGLINIFVGVNPLEELNTFTNVEELVKELEKLKTVRRARPRQNGIFYISNNRNLWNL